MNWLLLHSGPCDPAFNMALDEALLDNAARLGRPILRLYGWTEPAATFGYFQKFSDVESATRLRPLIRRPTGGGIVPHDADWTYSAIFPPAHEWHSVKAEESYRRIHDWIRLAFAELQVETRLAPARKITLPGRCFEGYEKFDLLWHGKKIAGAAQRRNRLGLLIQGSIQAPPLALKREDFQSALRAVAARDFGAQWTEWTPDSVLLRDAEALRQRKFSQPAHNQKR
jgi:lipoate-protein ligase A